MNKKRVGVIGGGQLAWMMATATEKLGIDLLIQTPHKDDPAVAIAHEVIFAPIEDAKATQQLAEKCDVITFENEFIDLEALEKLESHGVNFRPKLSALSPLLDKYQQRNYLKSINIPVPKFTTLERSSSSKFDFPLVIKARRHGYDGQGTFIIKNSEELNNLLKKVNNIPLMVEEHISFERELAIMVARNTKGEIVTYPVVETYQKEQVCHWVIAPANISETIQLEAKKIAGHLVSHLDVVGIFGIEFFLTAEGKLLVNEIAPRTHNSGHYTLDTCDISQFEMQLRAVTNQPLGSTELNCLGAVMVNLLGYENSHHDYQIKRQKMANLSNTYVHWYGKMESRPGRKLGHVTRLIHDNKIAPESMAKEIESIWYGDN
ncbi:phosphoribosylaminoimidazole carboxylase, ATPase subunit [Crocosphaera subtropica ATCC 51142]|uniref:N5-carboxyaminoimidazole ribonucleotide synthase n=1 Tax=Crocosphaera subtropica (strain ATCC 51142 / BH68) TaxID=43989 RepID=B1WVN6_CROS5|nr:5-(carboxyamino)imidazole ribonucleotide synthase [Crocosphaera subtropica]ACB50623.1 phosphoribosylaminoimidazole carboxylase, ATPase subunit [Crocosphaera subtropica ATCC 51142]